MDVAIVGAGRVGTALGVLLVRAGHRVVAASGREATPARVRAHLPGVPVVGAAEAARRGELVLVAVPDDALPHVVADVASAGGFRPGGWAAHVSGAIGLDVLAPAAAAGAHVLAVHPLQTFADVEGAIERLPGCAVAVTADDAEAAALGERLAVDVGASPFRLDDAMRPLYHAAAVFASNHVAAAAAAAERLFRAAGVPDPAAAMAPLQAATLDNVRRLGPGAALTGPAVRGDVGTIERNLAALAAHAPDLVPAYVAMAAVAADVAVAAGRLDGSVRAALDAALDRWR
jgi:predicted short-subunit dehydrogenase-like oxidoreductase (DUF2520 family)